MSFNNFHVGKIPLANRIARVIRGGGLRLNPESISPLKS
jgi:hypothetical protein